MAATQDDIAKLRRLTAEPTDATYSDAALVIVIESHPLRDPDGRDPEHDDWVPTYSMNAAAADIWEEKAAAVACNFDFSADGASYQQSKVFDNYTRMAKRFRGRAPIGSQKLISTRREMDRYGNIAEVDQIYPTLAESEVFNA